MDTDLNVRESGPLRYLLSLPPATDEHTTAPLLCFLHGYDEAAPFAIERALTRHGPLAPSSQRLTRDRFVVVAPQLPQAGDHWLRYARTVLDIIDAVARQHAGEGAPVYLTGFSFGANGVFDLALAEPARWRALWPVDPTRVPEHDPKLPIWLSMGALARQREDAFVQALSLVRSEPGGTMPRANRVIHDDGLDHVGTAARAYADPRIYTWLLARGSNRDAARDQGKIPSS